MYAAQDIVHVKHFCMAVVIPLALCNWKFVCQFRINFLAELVVLLVGLIYWLLAL
jgi:hypothetical protein